MDPDVVRAKLESLRRCVDRLQAKAAPTPEALAGDVDRQDILSVNLERAVQVCVDISAHILSSESSEAPATMASGFVRLRDEGWISPETAERMRRAVGFRNISVHAYQEIDWQIVHAIVRDRLGDFRRFASEIAAKLHDS
jgi:uncharacterized protein YutE (UPF0331/DUF86 family)